MPPSLEPTEAAFTPRNNSSKGESLLRISPTREDSLLLSTYFFHLMIHSTSLIKLTTAILLRLQRVLQEEFVHSLLHLQWPPTSDAHLLFANMLSDAPCQIWRERIHQLTFLPNSAVFIAEPESMSPPLRPTMAEDDALISTFSQTPKQHRANIARRLSGRNMMKTSDLSLQFNTSQTTYPIPMRSKSKTSLDYLPDPIPDKHHYSNQVISKVSKWLEQEKTRRNAEKASTANAVNVDGTDQSKKLRIGHQRSTSELSEGSLALEKLGQILAESKTVDHDNSTTPTREREGSYFPRRRPSHRRLRQKSTLYSSDTEHYDGDPIVPTAEVVLDNSRTLGYSGGAAELATNTYDHSKRAVKEKEAWLLFKNEIVRLAHTLRLKGWRRVPLDRGGDIEVERLSGALTNAVYVVSPPTGLPETSSNNQSNNPSFVSMKPPP